MNFDDLKLPTTQMTDRHPSIVGCFAGTTKIDASNYLVAQSDVP